jgi:hypothetical protein
VVTRRETVDGLLKAIGEIGAEGTHRVHPDVEV